MNIDNKNFNRLMGENNIKGYMAPISDRIREIFYFVSSTDANFSFIYDNIGGNLKFGNTPKIRDNLLNKFN